MLGNGDDFHLGDAVIVAVLSVLLVMPMTDGFFVSIRIYFRSRQRKEKKHTHTQKKKPQRVHHYPVQIAWNETTPDTMVTLKIYEGKENYTMCWRMFWQVSPRSGSKQTLTRVCENVPSLPVRSYTIMA